MLDFRVETFLCVCQFMNYTKAAEHLNITQPAVSQHISYGSIAGMVVIAMLAVLVMVIFGASIKQKNELGMMMGFGCGMIFLLNILNNLLCTMGVLPSASVFLPFLSVGKSNIILSYALIGMVMSIYRYKDVYPRNVVDKVRLKKRLDINL